MIAVAVTLQFDAATVRRRVRQANIESLGRAGGAIRLTARRSIRRSDKPSAPGSPPHTRKGQLSRAIMYAVEQQKQCVVIGPEYATLGPAGVPHEFGGSFRGQSYQKRPFMGPALMKIKDRLPSQWAGSIR